MKLRIYLLLLLLAIPYVTAQDALGDVFSTLTGGFSFSGIAGTLQLLLVILIVAGFGFIVVWMVYQQNKYKIIAIVLAKRGNKYEFLRMDRVGLFRDKERQLYSKFRKTREKIENLDFTGIFHETRKKQFVVMIKEGEGAYYQMLLPQKFYTIDGKIALPVIDHNVMRSAMTTLANQQRKYRLQDSTFAKYGTHIAILVVVIVLVVGWYILLQKEAQLIGLIGELLNNVKGLQEALVNKAIEGG